jgi:hypothetical protein
LYFADLMSAQMNARRARAKAARKASKEGKKHKLSDTAAEFKIPAATATSSSSGSGSGDSSPDGETAAKKAKKSAKPPATAFGHQKEAKAAKVVKTIQDDPTKSEVYKRLFSTHQTALNQPKGNWVTFDPRYN